MIRYTSLIILCFLLSTCSIRKYKLYEEKKIKLSRKNSPSFTVFKNQEALIYMNNSDIIDIIEKELANLKLCEIKRNKYSAFLNKFKPLQENVFLYDECSLKLDTIKYSDNEKILPLRKLNINKLLEQTKSIQIDNLPLVNENDSIFKIYVFFNFIVNQLLIEGKVDIYHNKEKKFERFIIDRKIHLSGGHGARDVLFPDSSFAKNISYHSSAINPDFDCLDTIAIKRYLNIK